MENKIKDAIEKAYDKAKNDPDKNATEYVKIGKHLIKINVNAESDRTIWIRIKDKGAGEWR